MLTNNSRHIARLARDTLALVLAGDHVYKMDYGALLDSGGPRLTFA